MWVRVSLSAPEPRSVARRGQMPTAVTSAYRDSAKAIESEVRIASFGAPHEAALARAYLESEGIPCRITDDFLVGAALGYEAAFGGVKLFVRSSDALRASELLESYRTAPASRPRAETQPERLRRAFRTSIIGLVLFPVALHLLSLWLLRNVAYRGLNQADRKTYLVTLVLNCAALVVAALVLLA
jgi:hypothetical protein